MSLQMDLALTDSATARQTIYLRLLFSKKSFNYFYEKMNLFPAKTRTMLSDINEAELRLEREARQRNLIYSFNRVMKDFMTLFTHEEQLSLVQSFCDSEEFWNPSGRTLNETFCIFVWHQKEDSLVKAAAHLNGVLSGICKPVTDKHPWYFAHKKKPLREETSSYVREQFHVECQVLDKIGEIPKRQNRPELECYSNITHEISIRSSIDNMHIESRRWD